MVKVKVDVPCSYECPSEVFKTAYEYADVLEVGERNVNVYCDLTSLYTFVFYTPRGELVIEEIPTLSFPTMRGNGKIAIITGKMEVRSHDIEKVIREIKDIRIPVGYPYEIEEASPCNSVFTLKYKREDIQEITFQCSVPAVKSLVKNVLRELKRIQDKYRAEPPPSIGVVKLV